MVKMRFPEKFISIEEGVLVSIEALNDCLIRLSTGSTIKGRFVGKQRMFFNEIAVVNKKYFIAIYGEPENTQGRILTYLDFKYDHDINEAIRQIPNYRALLNTL